MEYKIKLWYWSAGIIVLAWRMKRNRTRMKYLIECGEAYSSMRLVRLDIDNQRMGCRMHGLLVSVLARRAALRKESCTVVHAKQPQKRQSGQVCSATEKFWQYQKNQAEHPDGAKYSA